MVMEGMFWHPWVAVSVFVVRVWKCLGRFCWIIFGVLFGDLVCFGLVPFGASEQLYIVALEVFLKICPLLEINLPV